MPVYSLARLNSVGMVEVRWTCE